MKTAAFIILILFIIFILWLIYELIKSIKFYKEKEAKKLPPLKYGDRVWYSDFTPSGPVKVEGMVINQVKTRVRMRADRNMKIQTVDRDDLMLIW